MVETNLIIDSDEIFLEYDLCNKPCLPKNDIHEIVSNSDEHMWVICRLIFSYKKSIIFMKRFLSHKFVQSTIRQGRQNVY